MPRSRTTPESLRAALAAQGVGSAADDPLPEDPDRLLHHLAGLVAADDAPHREALAVAVRALAARLASVAPGRHVEVRIPPYAAVQCVEGPRHTRGTPPNVVEADPLAFVRLAVGALTWADAVADGRVRTWGDRADLSPWLPLLI